MLHMRSLSDTKLRFQSIADCMDSLETAYSGPSFLFFARYYGNDGALWVWKRTSTVRTGPETRSSALPSPVTTPPSRSSRSCSWTTGKSARRGSLRSRCSSHVSGSLCARARTMETRSSCSREEGRPSSTRTGTKGSSSWRRTESGSSAIPGSSTMVIRCRAVQVDPYHNLVSVGRKNQSYKDAEHAVVLEKLESAESYTYIRADLSNAYRELDTYERSILFVRPDYFVVVDVVSSAKAPGVEPAQQGRVHTGSERLVPHPRAKAGMRIATASDAELTDSYAVYSDEQGPVAYHFALSPERTSGGLL